MNDMTKPPSAADSVLDALIEKIADLVMVTLEARHAEVRAAAQEEVPTNFEESVAGILQNADWFKALLTAEVEEAVESHDFGRAVKNAVNDIDIANYVEEGVRPGRGQPHRRLRSGRQDQEHHQGSDVRRHGVVVLNRIIPAKDATNREVKYDGYWYPPDRLEEARVLAGLMSKQHDDSVFVVWFPKAFRLWVGHFLPLKLPAESTHSMEESYIDGEIYKTSDVPLQELIEQAIKSRRKK